MAVFPRMYVKEKELCGKLGNLFSCEIIFHSKNIPINLVVVT